MQPFSSKRIALLTLGAAASDAMLWRASSRPRRERWNRQALALEARSV